ncbi:hypothetical protein ACMD2_03935 [Ananas comosus]|uniref:U-box domain-containing protein n=1 Tax=Ananas comosus TaxID=4615 RepID=A0A199V5Z5_ANACO|nr:hypothetical protein ACMD2_03935 [Ananas comosus]
MAVHTWAETATKVVGARGLPRFLRLRICSESSTKVRRARSAAPLHWNFGEVVLEMTLVGDEKVLKMGNNKTFRACTSSTYDGQIGGQASEQLARDLVGEGVGEERCAVVLGRRRRRGGPTAGGGPGVDEEPEGAAVDGGVVGGQPEGGPAAGERRGLHGQRRRRELPRVQLRNEAAEGGGVVGGVGDEAGEVEIGGGLGLDEGDAGERGGAVDLDEAGGGDEGELAGEGVEAEEGGGEGGLEGVDEGREAREGEGLGEEEEALDRGEPDPHHVEDGELHGCVRRRGLGFGNGDAGDVGRQGRSARLVGGDAVPATADRERSCIHTCLDLAFTPPCLSHALNLSTSASASSLLIPNIAIRNAILSWCDRAGLPHPAPHSPDAALDLVRSLMPRGPRSVRTRRENSLVAAGEAKEARD